MFIWWFHHHVFLFLYSSPKHSGIGGTEDGKMNNGIKSKDDTP